MGALCTPTHAGTMCARYTRMMYPHITPVMCKRERAAGRRLADNVCTDECGGAFSCHYKVSFPVFLGTLRGKLRFGAFFSLYYAIMRYLSS